MKDAQSHSKRPPLLTWLRIDSKTKPRVYAQVFNSAEMDQLTYWLEIFFSAGIATFGLVLNSPAVIIGGMLISPLMGPIMATGLSLAIGDLFLGTKAILNLVASIAVSVGFSGFLVWLLPFHSATAEILARTRPNLLDLGVALLSGLAGSVVVCRSGGKGGDGVTALPGVAIAVALMPPLCTIGFGLGSGQNPVIMGGAGLLFLTNLVAIVASAFGIFLLIGMNSSDIDAEAAASRTNDALAQRILRSPLARIFTSGTHLRWRILMIVIVLGSVAVPLRKALLQVAGEAIARGVVQSELTNLVSSDTIVTQQVQIDPSRIAIHLISTQPIPDAKTAQVRREIERRTGRQADISVDAVASRSELAELMARIRAPAPAPPKELTLAEMQKQLADRVQAAMQEIWPLENAPLQDVSVDLGAGGVALNVRYEAAAALGAIPTEVLLKSLRAKLQTPGLTLNLERTAPRRPARKR
ncbi:MAG: DUF389 domain-containing protein [Acidobacteriota bacterium]